MVVIGPTTHLLLHVVYKALVEALNGMLTRFLAIGGPNLVDPNKGAHNNDKLLGSMHLLSI